MNSFDECIGFNTVTAGKYISRLLNHKLKEYQLTAEQWTVLKRLDALGDMNQKKLSEVSRKDQATLTKILDLLEKNDFIHRLRNPNDRRSFLISISDKGRELTEELYEVISSIFDEVVKDITTENLQIYQSVSEKIQDNIRSIMSID